MTTVSGFAFFPGVFNSLVTDPNGAIARDLEAAGDIMVQRSREALSVDAPRPWGSVLHPPPGPPWRRTGDLQNSIQRTEAIVGAPNSRGPNVAVYVTAYSEHNGADYANILRQQGYKFIRDDDLEGGV